MGPGPEFSLPDRSGQSFHVHSGDSRSPDARFSGRLGFSAVPAAQHPYESVYQNDTLSAGIGERGANEYQFPEAATVYVQEHNAVYRHKLKEGQTVSIPTSPRYVVYTAGRDDDIAWITDRSATAYKANLFSDEFGIKGLNGRELDLSQSNASVIEGGIEFALGGERTVLDYGSGQGPALVEFALLYPGSTFWGIDTGYDQAADLQRDMPPGLYLSKDNWETLATVPDGSVDTFLSACGAFLHGMLSKDRKGSEEQIIENMTRAARGPGAIARYSWLGRNFGVDQKNEKMLERYSWDVKYGPNTAIAVYSP